MASKDFLFEDYKVKVQYLTDHFSRMWIRFNFLLTLNTALFAFSFQKGTTTFGPLFAGAGIVLCVLWYVFGANDNHLVEVYRKQIEDSYELLCWQEGWDPKHLSYAGCVPDNSVSQHILQWRLQWQWGGKAHYIATFYGRDHANRVSLTLDHPHKFLLGHTVARRWGHSVALGAGRWSQLSTLAVHLLPLFTNVMEKE
jgi:hypothetical protein